MDNFKSLLELAAGNNVDLSSFPYVSKLVELQLKEKLIDFNLANLEQAALAEEISNRGGGEELKDYLSKASSAIKASADPSSGGQFAYLQHILNIAKAKNILLTKYPNFVKYGEYLKDFSEIDLDQLLEEFTKAEDKVYLALLSKVDSSQKTVDRKSDEKPPLAPVYSLRSTEKDALLIRSIDRYIHLLQTAYRIQMTTKDFNLFKANEPDFMTPATLAFINRKLAELGYFQDLMPYESFLEQGKKALEAFYDSVSQRDYAFLQNTERILKEENQKVAVLISGGYHTPHLKKLFAEKGYSMAVLTPIVTSETNQQKYEKLLLAPIKKEIKKIEIVNGENKDDKPLSALEKDLLSIKKGGGVRVELALAEAEMNPVGSRLSQMMRDAGATPEQIEQFLNSVKKLTVTSPVGARLVAGSEKLDRINVIASTVLKNIKTNGLLEKIVKNSRHAGSVESYDRIEFIAEMDPSGYLYVAPYINKPAGIGAVRIKLYRFSD